MSEHQIYMNLFSAISSPELEAGPWRSSSLDGQKISPFGQALAPASRSHRQAEKMHNRMSATYGRILPGSLRSISLQSSLANKLMKRLPQVGWMMPLVIWKRKTTPALRRYCQLTVSARTLKERGFISVPRPLASDYRDRGNVSNPSIKRRIILGKQIHLSMHFKGTPCPTCVLAMMGYPQGWLTSLCTAPETLLFPKSQRNLLEHTNK